MDKLRNLISVLAGLLTLAGLVGMTACGPKETELPFETIELGDWAWYGDGGPDSVLKTRLVLVTSREEAAQLEDRISPEAMEQLLWLDFERYFAIALFRGVQPTSGYDTFIERVVRRGDKVVVHTQFWEPSPHTGVTTEQTSPYHLIKVRREDGVGQEIELVLQSHLVTPTPPF